MAIDTGALYYLVDPFVQWENVNGKPIVGGHVEVFEAGTDNKIITYADWDGTRHPFKIPLGSDGRAVILVDPGYRYDAYVYDSFNNLVCSRLNIIPLSDGDITIDGMGQVYHDETLSGKGTPNSPLTVISGGKVYGGIYPIDVNNELDMISADNVPLGVQAPLYFAQDDDKGLVIALSSVPVPEGTMNESAFGYEDGQITSYNGTAFSAGNTYEAGSYVDITNNTISVTGLTPVPADTASTGLVASVSADITALIPDISDMATQTWVNEQGFLTAHQDISNKLDTTAFSTVSGDFLTAIPSEYVTENTLQSGLSSKLDSTAFSTVSGDFLTAHQSLEGYATEQWVSAQGYLTAHQSLDGLMSADLLEISDNKITGYNGTAFAGQGGGGVTGDFELKEGNGIQLTDDPIAQTTTISVSGDYATNTQLQTVSGEITALIPSTAGLATTAQLADVSADITAQIPTDLFTKASADTLYQPIGNYLSSNALEGYATENWVTSQGYLTAHQDLSDYQTTAGMTAYLTTADSANFYTTANESGYITAVPDTYLQNTDLSTEDGKVTAISGIPLSAGGDVPEGVMVESGLEYNAVNEISAYNGSAIAQYGAEKQWLQHDDTIVHVSNSAQYAFGVNLSAVAQLLGVDETVLFSGKQTSAAIISEPLSAFERINIYMNRGDGNVGQAPSVLSFSVNSADTYVQLNWSLGANGWYNVFQKLTWTNNSVNVASAHAIYGGNFTATAISHESNTTLLRNTIQKVVGIGRKQ